MILGTQQKLVSLFLDAYKILSRFYKLTRNIYYQNSRNWKAVGHVLSAQQHKSSPGAAVLGRPAQHAYRSKPAQRRRPSKPTPAAPAAQQRRPPAGPGAGQHARPSSASRPKAGDRPRRSAHRPPWQFMGKRPCFIR